MIIWCWVNFWSIIAIAQSCIPRPSCNNKYWRSREDLGMCHISFNIVSTCIHCAFLGLSIHNDINLMFHFSPPCLVLLHLRVTLSLVLRIYGRNTKSCKLEYSLCFHCGYKLAYHMKFLLPDSLTSYCWKITKQCTIH